MCTYSSGRRPEKVPTAQLLSLGFTFLVSSEAQPRNPGSIIFFLTDQKTDSSTCVKETKVNAGRNARHMTGFACDLKEKWLFPERRGWNKTPLLLAVSTSEN